MGWKSIYGEFSWRAHYVRVMENGLDFAHGPFVHRNSFGDIHRPQIPEYKVVPAAGFGDWGSSAMVTLPAAPSTGLWRILGSLFAGRSRPDVPVSLSFYLPNIIRIHIRPRPGWDIVIFDSNIPVDEENTRTLWISLRNFLRGDWADANARKRTHKIFCEDLPIVESVRPVFPPVAQDHASELLVRSDQLVVAYRRLRRRAFELGWGLDLVRAAQLSAERPHVLPSPARRVPATQDLFVFSEVPPLPAGRGSSRSSD